MTPESRHPADAANHAVPKPAIPDYELLRRIGQGGYGDVWLGRGLTGAYRAVKVVWRDRFENIEPYLREFRGVRESMANSTETGQLALHHVGQNESAGFFYYVMELADDTTGGRAIDPARYVPLTLKELKAKRGRLSAAECINLAVELTRALHGMHSRGLVHRDIKPSNIVLVNGVPKLADVGLVAASTDARTFVGTQGYMPPEGPGTPAADVFALGKVVYELATGFERDEFPKLPAEFNDAADRRALFELNEILLRACEPLSEKRYRDAGALLSDLLALQDGHSLRRRRMRRALWRAGVVVAAVVLAGGGLWWSRRPAPPVPATAAPSSVAVQPPVKAGDRKANSTLASGVYEHSIAVLPFENLSDAKENGYLADGVQEDVLTDLAAVRGLKVYSRAYVMRYRGTTKTPSEIGAELGVAFVLNASLRREGNRVRLSAQLTDVRTDRQVWAKKFDREVGSMLALQSDLAGEIVPALQVLLSPEEKAALMKAPTSSGSAYDLYLQARGVREDGRYLEKEPSERAEALLQQAVAADPGFVRAWVELALLHSDRFFASSDDRGAVRIAKAEEAANKARALAPDAPEVLLALGKIRYTCYRDFAGTMFFYQKVLAAYPNYPEIKLPLGLLYRRLGRWGDALREMREACAQEPGNLVASQSLGSTLVATRRYAEVASLVDERQRRFPDRPAPAAFAAIVDFRITGKRDRYDRWLASLPAERQNSPAFVEERFYWAMTTGDTAMVLDMVDRYGLNEERLSAAIVLIQAGQKRRALELVAPIKREIEARVAANPSEEGGWSMLALCRALEGDRPGTLEAIERARQSLPESSDVFVGPIQAGNLAMARLWLGDKDVALDTLEALVRKPGFVQVWEVGTYVGWLPLHGEPRFEAMLADPRNRAPFVDDDNRMVDPYAGAASNPVTLTAPDPKSVAVLAFANLSDDKANEYFSDGLSEELMSVLARIPDLKVAARTSAFHFKGQNTPITEIGRQLGVGYVVEGSVRKSGDKVRIAARLVNASNGSTVWSGEFREELKDLFGVQDKIAGVMADNLQVKLGLKLARPPNPEAYQKLWEGRYFARQENREGWEQAVQSFKAAVELDPAYALAWAELARTQAMLGRYIGDGWRENFAQARLSAEKALALDANLALAHDALGWVRRSVDWNWRGAEESFRRAMEADPSDPVLVQDAAVSRWSVGKPDEAIALAREAVKRDPLNARAHNILAIFLQGDDLAGAEASMRRAVELAPTAILYRAALAIYLARLGRLDEAQAQAKQEPVENNRLVAEAFIEMQSVPESERGAIAERWAGREALGSGYQAQVAAYAGRRDAAFAALNRALAARLPQLAWARSDFYLRSLHNDPRWSDFLRRMGYDDVR